MTFINSVKMTALYSNFQVELSPPEHCERDIWDLLEECWNRDEDSRPTFSEISMFLKRKSLTVCSNESTTIGK